MSTFTLVFALFACFVSGTAMSYAFISWWLKRFLESCCIIY